MLAVLNSHEFRDLSPKQVIPSLADRGEYLGSESTAYRLLRAAGLLQHRESSRVRSVSRPKELVADGPDEVHRGVIARLELKPYIDAAHARS